MASPLGIRKLLRRATNRFRFEVGQYLLRGAFYRLLVIVSLVGIIALLGGLSVMLFDPAPMPLDEGTWWAFLRLTDPGYLGDDQGFFRRTISTIITVIGYVLFLGALVAIMTQWLNQTLRQLESGLSPIARDGHVLVAGWTDRTLSVLREMFRSEDRSHSLLGGRGSRLTTVVLAEHAGPELHQRLRDSMGEHFDGQQIILRQGEAIHLDHLRRADFAHASAIVLPGEPYLGEEHAPSDVRVMKTLMSIARHVRTELGEGQSTPLVVAELFDARREEVAKALYPGRVEVVVSDRLIGRMLALNLRHAGLAHVYRELLFEREGQRLSKTALPEALFGKTFHDAVRALNRVAVLGVVRAGELTMCPEPYFRLAAEDSLIMFGRENDLSHHDSDVLDAPRLSLVPFERARGAQALRSLLVLGWTHKVPVVLSELVQSCQSSLQVKVLSTIDLASRQEDVLAAGGGNLTLDHALADYTVPEVLKACSPAGFDAVLLVGSDRLESGAESDARSIVGCQVLRSCLAGEPRKPRIVIELMDPDNAALLDHDEVEALVSPQLLGRALAQVALVPDLCAVYDDLFGAGGAELSVHSASEYGIDGATMTFGALRVAAARMGHVLLGAQAEGERTINMNPPPSTPFDCARDVRVVVAVRAE